MKNCAALLAKIEASKGNQEQRGKTITSESRDEEQGFETAGQILLMK